MSSGNGAGNEAIVLVLTMVSVILPALWKAQVTSIVPEPYLDEVFHIRQAQAYCAGYFHVWDSKITTPPGLYFAAWGWNKLFGCNVDMLRYLSATCLGVFFTQALFSSDIIDLVQRGKSTRTLKEGGSYGFQEWLKAFNMMTFPPLFFFSALFYTDVASTVLVYLYFQLFLNRLMVNEENVRKEVIQVGLGIASLLFRQTNVFWVAVFPAGLAIIQGTKACSPDRSSTNKGPQSFAQVVQLAWKESIVYDPPVAEAWLDDYIKVGLSIAIVAGLNIGSITSRLYPSLMLLNVFVAFVAWNGGVVLGDKSNHIVTIHTPQMLYIWPYMLFFSWPLTIPTAFKIMQGFFSAPKPLTLVLRRIAIFSAWTALALAAIHFNTIIHPFLLADNRHYTFYVFKIIRQHPDLLYYAAPVYVLSAYLIIQTLGTTPPPPEPAAESSSSTSAPAKPAIGKGTIANPEEPGWVCAGGVRASFVLVWVAATALTLVTAPLVEPRYAILPWLFWRAHVPAVSTAALLPARVKARVDSRPPGRALARADARMRIEMVWHLVVDGVAAWAFLYRGFEWPGEEYRAVVQRFMW